MARHGTARGYVAGCRCDACRKAHRLAARDYRRREATVAVLQTSGPGPIERAVVVELGSLRAATDRPGVAAAAVVLARVLDGPAAACKPSAARVLADILDRLWSASAPGRRGRLAVVRALTADDTPGA